jgi:hypothetical protein
VNVLSAACTNHFIDTILYNEKLTCVENHADIRIREVKLLIATSSPWDLRELARIHISQ